MLFPVIPSRSDIDKESKWLPYFYFEFDLEFGGLVSLIVSPNPPYIDLFILNVEVLL